MHAGDHGQDVECLGKVAGDFGDDVVRLGGIIGLGVAAGFDFGGGGSEERVVEEDGCLGGVVLETPVCGAVHTGEVSLPLLGELGYLVG